MKALTNLLVLNVTSDVLLCALCFYTIIVIWSRNRLLQKTPNKQTKTFNVTGEEEEKGNPISLCVFLEYSM